MAQSESDLMRLLHSTEHSFVERKTVGDSRDWVKTVVAFANTLSNEQEGVLFIGATDSGEIEATPSNLDKLQKTFSEKMQSAFPPIYYTTRVLREDDRECLAIIVPGSALRPHFAGPLYIRDGSQSLVAKSELYESLLASRIGKVYELQKWVGRLITLRMFDRPYSGSRSLQQTTNDATVIGANQFYLTVLFNNRKWSYPLSRFEIAFDHVSDRLEIELRPPEI